MRKQILGFLFIGLCGLVGCGGSSSSDSGTLIEGTLIEAGGAGHASVALTKHSVGQTIEKVTICALGECSVTDGAGQWGFVLSDTFPGGEVQFDVNGHGIETKTVVNIPGGAKDIFIDFRHVEGGKVEAHHLTVDGEEQHLEDHH